MRDWHTDLADFLVSHFESNGHFFGGVLKQMEYSAIHAKLGPYFINSNKLSVVLIEMRAPLKKRNIFNFKMAFYSV